MKLEDKVAIVTGGARGIGAAVCRRYADEGARVVVADLLMDEARGLAAEIGRGAFAVELNVTKQSSIDAAVAAVVAHCDTSMFTSDSSSLVSPAPP